MNEHDMREGEMHASGIGMGGAAIAHTWTCQIGSKGQTKGHGPPVNHLKSLGSKKNPLKLMSLWYLLLKIILTSTIPNTCIWHYQDYFMVDLMKLIRC
jgi:hypothetical protein